MDYIQIANSGILYMLAGLVILIVVIQSLVFLKMAFKRGYEIGLSKKIMMEAVRTSLVFAIVPSIPIVISLMAIAPVLGIPFSWMRLSVIGSQSYELIAAGIGAKAMGVNSLGEAGYSGEVFANSMWVMSIGIIWGLVLCIFALKKYQAKMIGVKKKDSAWAEIMVNALFFGMISVFLGQPLVSLGLPLWVLLGSALIMVVMTKLSTLKPLFWLKDFALSLSMVGGMALAIFLTNLGL